jgi:hypothetical protein
MINKQRFLEIINSFLRTQRQISRTQAVLRIRIWLDPDLFGRIRILALLKDPI